MRLRLRMGVSHFDRVGRRGVSMCCGRTGWHRIVSTSLRTTFPGIFLSRIRRAHIPRKHTFHRCPGYALCYDAPTPLSRSSQQTNLAPDPRGAGFPSRCSCPGREGPAIAQHHSSAAVCQLPTDSRGYTKPSAGAADVPASVSSRLDRSGPAYPLLPSAAAGLDPAAAYGVQLRGGTGSGAAYGQL